MHHPLEGKQHSTHLLLAEDYPPALPAAVVAGLRQELRSEGHLGLAVGLCVVCLQGAELVKGLFDGAQEAPEQTQVLHGVCDL